MSKIVIITNIPSPYRLDLFYYLQTHVKEHSFHVIYTSAGEDNRSWTLHKEKMRNTQVLNAQVVKLRGKLDTRYIHIPCNVGKVLSELAPDVVIASEYNPAAIQALLWTKAHCKKFIHWTDGTLHSERNIGVVQKITRKIICRNADACIASSTKAEEKLLAWEVPEEKIFISLLTVDISYYRKLMRNPIPGRILYVGSMVPRKGLDLLVDALSHVSQDFELRIVGNGTQEEINSLKAAAEKSGVLDKMVCCGFLQGSALMEEYQKAQVFVLPTREDCFGLVLLEAMCAGVPIVASKYADGAYDTVAEGQNGYIADPFSPIEFAQTIERVLEESELLSANEEQVEKFSFANVSKAYMKAVDYVLQS